MNKKLWALLIVIFICTFSTAVFSEKTAVVAVLPVNDYPFVYADKDGTPQGFLVTYLKAFATYSGTNVEIKLAEPGDMMLIYQHSGDLLFDSNMPTEANTNLISTRPFMVLENVLVVRHQDFTQNASIKTFTKTAPLFIGTKLNTSRLSLLDNLTVPKPIITTYYNNRNGLLDVKSGKLDGFLLPSNQATKLINEGQLRNLKTLKENNFSETYAFRVKDEELASQMNNFITYYNRSDAYHTAYKAYFDTVYLKDFFKNYYIYIFNVATIFLLISVMGLAHYISKSQKKVIQAKDLELERQIESNKTLLNTVLSHERTLNDYFVNLNHEFRSPLNMILSVSQATEVLAKTMNIRKLVQNNHSYNKIIKTNVFRMMKLINNITDLKKLDQNLYTTRYETLDAVYLCEELIEQIQAYTASKPLQFELITNQPEIFIHSDPIILKRILTNLISNAIKHGEKTSLIQLHLISSSETLIIKVFDNGVGIHLEELKDVFNSYSKLKTEPTTFHNQEGAGIGLTLVKRFIELMNGSIEIESEQGSGTTVTISVPLSSHQGDALGNPSPLHSEQIVEIELSDIWKSDLIG